MMARLTLAAPLGLLPLLFGALTACAEVDPEHEDAIRARIADQLGRRFIVESIDLKETDRQSPLLPGATMYDLTLNFYPSEPLYSEYGRDDALGEAVYFIRLSTPADRMFEHRGLAVAGPDGGRIRADTDITRMGPYGRGYSFGSPGFRMEHFIDRADRVILVGSSEEAAYREQVEAAAAAKAAEEAEAKAIFSSLDSIIDSGRTFEIPLQWDDKVHPPQRMRLSFRRGDDASDSIEVHIVFDEKTVLRNDEPFIAGDHVVTKGMIAYPKTRPEIPFLDINYDGVASGSDKKRPSMRIILDPERATDDRLEAIILGVTRYGGSVSDERDMMLLPRENG